MYRPHLYIQPILKLAKEFFRSLTWGGVQMSATTKLPTTAMDRLLRIHIPGLETILSIKEYAEATGAIFTEDYAGDFVAQEVLAD
jgi:hypothetical protein